MIEIIIWAVVGLITCLVFLVIFIRGLIEKRIRTILFSLILLFLGVCSGLWAVYLFTSKSYKVINDVFKPRSGDKIYEALFGLPVSNCVIILNYQDQVVPRIDYAIWLHFKTCPAELERIVSLRNYHVEIVSTEHWETEGPSANEN